MHPEGHVVLVHGFPLGRDQWRSGPEVPAGWTLLTPDLPGFGSSRERPVDTIDAMGQSVFRAMDAAGITAAVIGGLSMGGYVTLAMYRRAPHRFRGMVLADTRSTADTPQQKDARVRMIELVRSRGAAAVADEMLPRLLGPRTHAGHPEVVADVRRIIERNRPEVIEAALEALMARPDATDVLPEVKVPTLIVCGEDDGITPPADSEALHRGIRGSRYERIPGAGHLANIEAPQAFTSALASFLSTIPATTSP